MVRIIIDSASDITLSEVAKLNVEMLPIITSFNGVEYEDGITITHDEFFEKLIETAELPKTSQVNPFAYEKAFEEVVKAGDTAVCLTVTGKLSGCYQSACIAADEYDGQIIVVDTESAALGERLIIEMAVNLRDEGKTAEEIAEIINKEKKNLCLIALLDTVEYLKKGGRISAAVAAACGLLSIKPVITITDGEIVLLGKARGSKNGNNKLTEFIKKTNGIDFDKPHCLAYSGLSDVLLQKYLKDNSSIFEGHENPRSFSIGAAIGTHVGPGAIACAFFQKEA